MYEKVTIQNATFSESRFTLYHINIPEEFLSQNYEMLPTGNRFTLAHINVPEEFLFQNYQMLLTGNCKVYLIITRKTDPITDKYNTFML